MKDDQFYFWTGGRLSGDKTTLNWPDGQEEMIVRGKYPWSEKGLRGAQPDGQRAEDCLAVLNNIYEVRKSCQK